jgi:hypothetical protein
MTEKPALRPVQDYQMRCLITHGIKADVSRGNPNYYLAIDPGEGTGWATFSENGLPTDYGNVYGDAVGFYNFLHRPETFQLGFPRVVIYEKWGLLKFKNKQGSTMLSSQVIGVIRGWGTSIEAELISQEPGLNIGNAKESGINAEGPHSQSHWTLAFNHGWHYLNEKRIVIPRLLWPEG